MTPDQIDAMRRAAEAPEIADAAGADRAAQDLAAAFVADPLFDWFSRPTGSARPDGWPSSAI